MNSAIPTITSLKHPRQPGCIRLAAVLLCAFGLIAPESRGNTATGDAQYAFLSDHFTPGTLHTPAILWITGEVRQQARTLLDHEIDTLRIRYWAEEGKTAWILEEVGKELPITIGVLVNNQRIAEVRILKYRESRGGDVAYPFFTRQFRGLELTEPARQSSVAALSGHIDGITGATLSVNAVKKVAALALLFDRQASAQGD